MLNCIYHENPDIIYVDGYHYKVPRYLKRNSRIFVYVNEPFIPADEKEEITSERMSIRIYTIVFNLFGI